MEHPKKSGLSTPTGMPTQEIFNIDMIVIFLSFQKHPYATYLVKPNQSYRNRKNSEEARFSAECWKQV
jgi:hypothetical protein